MGRILLVDDNKNLLTMADAFLRQAGHTVHTTSDSTKTLGILEQQAFDLIVTDILMPGKEGVELIKEVRARFPDMPIVAISGGGKWSSSSSVLMLARKMGAMMTLAKPFSGQELIEAVDAALSAAA